ncbi:MAG: AmmeMemoRadiSam system protein A [Enhygromyxa sp.]
MSALLPIDPRELEGDVLLALARGAVAERFGATDMLIPARPWLTRLAATFVTITCGERLHGCIGSVEPQRSLLEDLRHNAVLAAFHDPRTRALRPDELELVTFCVSILGPRAPIDFTDEADARRQLRPQVDGVILSHAGHRGLFLPQVWETLPEPGAFLDNLKRKAGLATTYWHDQIQLERFEVTKFAEQRTHTEQSRGWHH